MAFIRCISRIALLMVAMVAAAHADPAPPAPPAAAPERPAERPAPRPDAFIRTLYRALDTGEAGLNPATWTTAQTAALLFTPDIAALAEEEGRRALPDRRVPFDPFTGPAAARAQRFAVRIRTEGGGRAEVSARAVASGRIEEVVFRLVETPAGWRIADIRWGEGYTRSLKALLR